MAHFHPDGEAATTIAEGVDAGHHEPLEALAREYRGALLRFFTKQLGSSADAEDLTQEVFVRLVRHKDRKSIRHMEAYLFQTASNLLRDHVRRNATHRVNDHVSFEEFHYEGHYAGAVPSEEYVYEGREAIDAFLSVLAELPPRRRTVFLMHRFQGYSYGAIATKLGISVSVVEKHMMKALLQFHTRLGPL
jgi:RNA polymerase sigma-70 factor (ECF subfamily)